MSYILDALRRAQNERENKPLAPHIESTEDGRPVISLREASPVWMIAAAAAAVALLVAGLLAWILWPDSAESGAEAPAAETVAATPAAVAPAPAAAPSSSINSLDDIAVSDGGAPTSESLFNEVPPLASDEEIHQPAASPSITATAPPPSTAAEPPAPAVIAEEPAAAPPQPARSSTVQLQSPVQSLSQMPDDYRAAFPKLKVEVHVYDEDPAARFVLIEGRRYKEGDALAQGAQLVRITSEGLVCSFRGSDVLVPVTN